MANITGLVRSLVGVNAGGKVYLTYLSAPSILRNALVKSSPSASTTADDDGNFEFIDVTPGGYEISLSPNGSGPDKWRLDVPNDSATYDVLQLITPKPFTQDPSKGNPMASAAYPGIVRMNSAPSGIPVVYSKADVDALLASLMSVSTGTFTPSIYGSTGTGTATYSTAFGRYSKVGKIVHFFGRVSWSSHTGTGNMRLTGWPGTANNPQVAPVFMLGQGFSFAGTLGGIISVGDTSCDVRGCATGANAVAVAVAASGTIDFHGSFEATT